MFAGQSAVVQVVCILVALSLQFDVVAAEPARPGNVLFFSVDAVDDDTGPVSAVARVAV